MVRNWILMLVVILVSMSTQQSVDAGQAPGPRMFASDSGMVLNFVKPDRTADFEAVIRKVKEALQKSENEERRREAAGWKVFRAIEPGAGNSVLYVFVMDPAVKGADYTVSTILAEAFPNEGPALYKQYSEAYASGQRYVMNLTLVSALGQWYPAWRILLDSPRSVLPLLPANTAAAG